MSNKHINEKDLVQQLNQLPSEIEAPNKWSSIRAAIENGESNVEQISCDSQSKVPGSRGSKNSWWPMAVAASLAMFFVVATVWLNLQSPDDGPLSEFNAQYLVMDSKFAKTVVSLQQANNRYYQALGNKLLSDQKRLDKSIQESLKDFRTAQREYRVILKSQPDNHQLQAKLIDIYYKERKLLRKIIS